MEILSFGVPKVDWHMDGAWQKYGSEGQENIILLVGEVFSFLLPFHA